MSSRPIEPLRPKYPNYRWTPTSDYFQPETPNVTEDIYNNEHKIQVLQDCGYYTVDMNVTEINNYYRQIVNAQQKLFNNKPEKTTVISSVVVEPKIIEKKLIEKPDLNKQVEPKQVEPKQVEPKQVVSKETEPEPKIDISIDDMKDILQIYNVNTKSMSIKEIRDSYIKHCMSEFATSKNTQSSPVVIKKSENKSCRDMIRENLEQLVTDVEVRTQLLTNANNNKSNICIDLVTNFIITASSKLGGISDIQYEFLSQAGMYNQEASGISHPNRVIPVVEKNEKYNITNAVNNIANGACGINWIPAALRSGLITMNEVNRNLFNINERSDSDNQQFRQNIMRMYGIRKHTLNCASRNFGYDEKTLSALLETAFTNEFLVTGYYIRPEEVYAIAYMLDIKVKILTWDKDNVIVFADQTKGKNAEPVYLYLWGNHYYIMKKTE